MRKAMIYSLCFLVFLSLQLFHKNMITYATFTPNFPLYSEGVYMVNTDTDIVLVSKNAHQKLYPASTTKIMTCLVAIENIKDFDAKVLVPYETLNEFNSDNINFNDVSSAAIEPLQDNLTYWDCLYSLMICSACDSANVLAYNVGGGSIETFVNMMNNTARRIGCKNTNFMNAHYNQICY